MVLTIQYSCVAFSFTSSCILVCESEVILRTRARNTISHILIETLMLAIIAIMPVKKCIIDNSGVKLFLAV